MEIALASVVVSLALVSLVTSVWRVLNWVWLRPRRLERCLRQQGLSGNSYKLFHGDLEEMAMMKKHATVSPIGLSDDIRSRVLPFQHHSIQKYGKKCFVWIGPRAKVNIMEAKMIREIMSNYDTYRKSKINPLSRLLVGGLVAYEGHYWFKQRTIINHAFHLDKLKNMLAAVHLSCEEMLRQWDQQLDVQNNGSCELDVWPCLEKLTSDVISRAALGSSFEEGRKIFQLQKEQASLLQKLLQSTYIPGWRFLPTKSNNRMKEIYNEMNGIIRGIIHKREKAMEAGEAQNHDLLGTLMESNLKEIQEHKGKKEMGMSIDEVIAECKLFYIAGEETTRNFLVWTIVLLCKHQNWQALAREEVVKVFGKNKPDYDGLSRLKIVGMILLEVLRLYPPLPELDRATDVETKLGELSLPKGVVVSIPIALIHRDPEIWGDDAEEFNPERFLGGVSGATKSQPAFLAFSLGPRVCIGQNFATIETKVALAMILQRFSFELSPTYAHAPCNRFTIQPQHGAQIVIHKI